MQNLLLAAHGRAWRFGMTGPLMSADGIREILQVPPPWHIAALVPIGYPDEEPVARRTARASIMSPDGFDERRALRGGFRR
jgi:nitroreductase